MTDEDLFQATVPVMQHYFGQSLHILRSVPEGRSEVLQQTLVPEGFSAGFQIWVAQNFAMRGVCPVMDQAQPDLQESETRAGVLQHGQAVLTYLEALTPADFRGAATREIVHQAGQAELRQSGQDYLLAFILPNLLFHLTTGFAILRQHGIALGKADFDGLHHYEPGFVFEDEV